MSGDEETNAIRPFAAFCKEGADEELPTHEAHAPSSIFHGDGTDVDVGVCHRPHLLRVATEWEQRR